MEKCVLSCSSFHAIATSHKLRTKIWRNKLRDSGAGKRSSKRGLNVVICCSQEENLTSTGGAGGEDDRFLHLIPKPKPVPIPVNEERLRQEQQNDEESKRIMTFLQNFPDKPQDQTSREEIPDPGKDNFREEMRKRLLYSEPPSPTDEEDEDEKRANIEFDMFEHLVLTIRHILHLRYSIGERLGIEDELILLEEAIPYHPEREFKVGVGIDYIKVDVHPEFGSRCFFIVRKDKSEIDFSYRKCMMGLAQARPGISVERARDLIYFFKTKPHYSIA